MGSLGPAGPGSGLVGDDVVDQVVQHVRAPVGSTDDTVEQAAASQSTEQGTRLVWGQASRCP